MDKFYNISKEETLEKLESSYSGLSNAEAEERRGKYGDNALKEEKKESVFMVFLKQFKDLLVIILIIAAIVSAFTGGWESALVIVAVIVLNAVLGTVQHVKAEKSLASLKALSAPTAKVMRDGSVTVIPSKEITIGDVVILEAGDLIVADGRIIENHSLQVNESSLTGESTVVDKSADVIEGDNIALGDRINMVFSGSLVTYGRAVMVVTGIGMDTEIGKIAALMNATRDRKTPLQKSLDKFSKLLAVVIMIICLGIFGLTMWTDWNAADVQGTVINALLFAVALAVAAIPEALSSIVTIVQAVGTQKMAKQNAIIKDLKAVESLGSVSIICSDKTGTLTQNKMTAQSVYVAGETYATDSIKANYAPHTALLHAMVCVNDSTINNGEEIGDPTEIALTKLGRQYGYNEREYREANPRISEVAFDSDRKLMSILQEYDGRKVIFTKGAIDVLLRRSKNILTENGVRELTNKDMEDINKANLDMSMNGLRVLAFAMADGGDKREITTDDEYGYTFIGLVSMIDPPREESKQAVADAITAGIKPIMITGDHKLTASAIARQIGIMSEGDIALEGVELQQLSDKELDEMLPRVSVYARVSPEHKIRIVEAWQRRGNIVAMTGDGVNDAPALKKSDVGVAMGITGTEVSKDAADMILTDDNFATIVKSVANGRSIYTNIKNAIIFLLGGNIAGIFCILLTSMLSLPRPFETVHLLFINLLTDSLPAIAIGMESASKDVLYQKPRDPKASILDRNTLLKIALQGAVISAFTMGVYIIGLRDSWAVATTMAFATISLARLFHGFNCRGESSIFRLKLTTNKYQIYAFLGGVALLSCALFIPGVNDLFMAADLTWAEIGYIVLFAFMPTVVIQIAKVIADAVKDRKRGKSAVESL